MSWLSDLINGTSNADARYGTPEARAEAERLARDYDFDPETGAYTPKVRASWVDTGTTAPVAPPVAPPVVQPVPGTTPPVLPPDPVAPPTAILAPGAPTVPNTDSAAGAPPTVAGASSRDQDNWDAPARERTGEAAINVRRRRGFASTIATSAQGDPSEAFLGRRSLLGG